MRQAVFGTAAWEARMMSDEWDIPRDDAVFCPICGAETVSVVEHYEIWGGHQWRDTYYCPICDEGDY